MHVSKDLSATALSAALSLSAAACSPGEPTVIHEYDAYQGDAYPNRRTPLQMPAGGAVFVTNSYADTLSVLDATTGEMLGTYPVGRDPVSLDGPHHVAVSPSGDAVYIALSYPVTSASGPHASHGSSARSGYVQRLDGRDLHVIGEVRVDDNPGDITLSEDGERLVVSHFDLQRALQSPASIDGARATVALIDPSTVALTGSPSPVRVPACVTPHGVALSRPDGATAYVACYGEDDITIVDTVSAKVKDRVHVAGGTVGAFGDPQYGPYSAAMSPSGATVAIGDTVSKDVRFLDTATGKMAGVTLPMLGAPYFMAWSADEKTLAVPLQAPDALVVVDLETKTETLHRDFTGDECPLPHAVVNMPDGGYALLCEGDHKTAGKVLWLDPTTLATVRSASVGLYPDGIVSFKEAHQ